MSDLVEKQYQSNFGEISYFRAIDRRQPFDVLFIHGLGADKAWFADQFPAHSLGRYSWLVPDLLGFGTSAKPQAQDAYTMDRQAEILMDLLLEEKVESLVILAHSMGGPIAVSLIELLTQRTTVRATALFYLEGNLDINDAYLSGKFASLPFNEYAEKFRRRLETVKRTDRDLYEAMCETGPLPFWASSVDLLRVSRSGGLLQRIQSRKDLPAVFVFGERNKGRFSSEESITQAGLPVRYVPDADHLMYLDNPKAFWPLIWSEIGPRADE